MKDIQEYIPITQNKIVLAKVYYIEITYVYNNNKEEIEKDNLLGLYSTKNSAQETIDTCKESPLPVGIKDIRYKILHKLIELYI